MIKWLLAFLLFTATQPAAVLGDTSQAPAFWHLGLLVRDLDLMDRFYGEVIGLRRVSDLLVEDADAASGAERAILVERLDALMAVRGARIEIRHYSDPQHDQFLELLRYPDHPAETVEHWTHRPYGFGHLGISVAAIDPVLQRMEESGLGQLMSGPQELAEFGGLRYAFLKDPEGNIVELMERDPPR
jgi:catechol 2,3-dioxygenase-like lactoylglutathione lyase family enzyme